MRIAGAVRTGFDELDRRRLDELDALLLIVVLEVPGIPVARLVGG